MAAKLSSGGVQFGCEEADFSSSGLWPNLTPRNRSSNIHMHWTSLIQLQRTSSYQTDWLLCLLDIVNTFFPKQPKKCCTQWSAYTKLRNAIAEWFGGKRLLVLDFLISILNVGEDGAVRIVHTQNEAFSGERTDEWVFLSVTFLAPQQLPVGPQSRIL